MNLLNDISRCSNDKCPLKEKCKRWLDRFNGRVITNFQNNQMNGCENQIKM